MAEATDIVQARQWASAFAERFPEIEEVYLVGSRVTGEAQSESDFDVILLVRDGGELDLSKFESIPANETAWGWLLPDEAAGLGFAPDANCDVMLVHLESDEFKMYGFDFYAPHALLWRRLGHERATLGHAAE